MLILDYYINEIYCSSSMWNSHNIKSYTSINLSISPLIEKGTYNTLYFMRKYGI